MKHAGKSLVNPPLPSALEEKLLIYLFIMFGVVNPDEIDLQVTIGGRLNNENAGLVCASSILAGDLSVEYAPNAFRTVGHDIQTDVRMMVYDAGVRKHGLPYDVKGAHGRTDRIGCRSLSDINLIRLLGTFFVHRQFGSSYADRASVYADNFKELLNEHGLKAALTESAWVSEKKNPNDPPEYHEEMVGKFCAARRNNPELVAQTRVLIAGKLYGFLRDRREEIISADPEEFFRMKNQ